MEVKPTPTVGALIVNKEGKILLIRSYKWLNGKYSVPGGHIEPYERIEEAIKREVKEEVGLDVEVKELLLIQQVINPKEFYDKKRHFIFFDFLCFSKNDEVKIDNREIQDFIWVKPEEALNYDLEEYTRNLINKYLRYLKGERNTELV
jgi:ADP-ribose pyrophosphatase